MKSEVIVIILLIAVFGSIYFLNQNLTGSSIVKFSEVQKDQGVIIIPVKVHIIVDNSGRYTSNRNEENIIHTLNEANRIWSQGNIVFQIEEIQETRVDFNTIPLAINGNIFELIEHENFDPNKINVFFTQSLNNINGLALSRINSVLVADFTTVNDFRTTAHEFGHLLGLRHVTSVNSLMARGKNGEFLSQAEIDIARENVGLLFR